jgi:hypothetical protein
MACFNHLVARRTTSRPFIDAALLSPFHAYLVKTFFLPAPNQAALGKKKRNHAGLHAPVVRCGFNQLSDG